MVSGRNYCGIIGLVIAVGVFCLLTNELAAKAGYHKEVEFGKTVYLKRSSKAWKDRSRFVGEVKNPPKKYTLEVRQYGLSGDPVVKLEMSGNFHVFESSWLQPGKYDITVIADGYKTVKISGVELKPGTDCLVNVKFGKEEMKGGKIAR